METVIARFLLPAFNGEKHGKMSGGHVNKWKYMINSHLLKFGHDCVERIEEGWTI